MQDTAAGGGQQQGAEDVLPKAHTKSQKMVKSRLNTLTLPSCHAVSMITCVQDALYWVALQGVSTHTDTIRGVLICVNLSLSHG